MKIVGSIVRPQNLIETSDFNADQARKTFLAADIRKATTREHPSLGNMGSLLMTGMIVQTSIIF